MWRVQIYFLLGWAVGGYAVENKKTSKKQLALLIGTRSLTSGLTIFEEIFFFKGWSGTMCACTQGIFWKCLFAFFEKLCSHFSKVWQKSSPHKLAKTATFFDGQNRTNCQKTFRWQKTHRQRPHKEMPTRKFDNQKYPGKSTPCESVSVDW